TDVFRERPFVEEAQPLLCFGELRADKIVWVGAHQPLRQVVRLVHKEPVPGKGPPLSRNVVEQIVLRDDVKDGRALDLVRLIKAHAMETARPTVVAGGGEA